MSKMHFYAVSPTVIAVMVALVLGGALSGCETFPDGKKEIITESLGRSAAASEESGEYQAAANQYRSLYNRQPENQTALLGLARNLRYSGNAEAALKVLLQAGAGTSGKAQLLLELAKASIARSKAEQAVGYLKTAIKAGAEDWDVYSTLGIAHDLLQSYDDAWTAYTQAIKLSPGNGQVINNMALSAAMSGKLEMAIKILEEAPLPVRRNPQMRQNLAFFYGIRGDLKKAGNLAKMDLSQEAVRNNMAVFSRFRNSQRKP